MIPTRAVVALALLLLALGGCAGPPSSPVGPVGPAGPAGPAGPSPDLAPGAPPCLPVEAAEPAVTLEAAEADPPGPNQADEPLRPSWSPQRAAAFLDATALLWQKRWGCFTCHTNFAYLMARPSLPRGSAAPAYQAVRAAAEEMVSKTWPSEGPRWDAEVVTTAAVLGFGDAAQGRLRPATRAALERMWTLQHAAGHWTWLSAGLPPLESEDHYGVTLAAVAIAVAPEDYAATAVAQEGLQRMKGYLRVYKAETVHQHAMLLWADALLGARFTLLTPDERAATIATLRKLQQPDGGFSLPSLGPWERLDGSAQSTDSDGYGTAFTAYVLMQAGVPPTDATVARALDWLRGHQRVSGRWFTRSATRETNHYISHAGTAFALMALTAACR